MSKKVMTCLALLYAVMGPDEREDHLSAVHLHHNFALALRKHGREPSKSYIKDSFWDRAKQARNHREPVRKQQTALPAIE